MKSRMGMIILRVTYGYKIMSASDPMLAIQLAVSENFSKAAAPGRWLVDIVPARKYLDLQIPLPLLK